MVGLVRVRVRVRARVGVRVGVSASYNPNPNPNPNVTREQWGMVGGLILTLTQTLTLTMVGGLTHTPALHPQPLLLPLALSLTRRAASYP